MFIRFSSATAFFDRKKRSRERYHIPKSEHMRLSMSEKKGMTSAITNAMIQVTARMPTHTDHPTTVLE